MKANAHPSSNSSHRSRSRAGHRRARVDEVAKQLNWHSQSVIGRYTSPPCRSGAKSFSSLELPALHLSRTKMELNWKNDISQEDSIPPINWNALEEYALDIKRSRNPSLAYTCHVPPIYNNGGLHPVTLLICNDGTKWIARIQLHECTPSSRKRLLHEVHTLSIVRERTDIPVPEVFGYEASGETIGRAFMLMEFVPGSTAMDSCGGWEAHHGKIPTRFQGTFSRNIASIQVTSTLLSYYCF